MSKPPKMKPAIGELIMGMTTFGSRPFVPVQDRPVTARGGDRGAAQTADQRVTGTGRQAEQPRDQVPDDRGDQGAQRSWAW